MICLPRLAITALCLGVMGAGAVHAQSQAPIQSACPAIPGAAALFDRPGVHIVWVGEMHGTGEMPAMFGDLVCAAGAGGRPVIVALERNQLEQPLWDAFLQSDGSDKAVAAFLSGPLWVNMCDGRTSRAMLALTERLRAFKASGRIKDVRLFVPSAKPGGDINITLNAGMAKVVSDLAQAQPDALVLVYSGNLHARKNTPGGLNFKPAASLIPPSQILAVNLVGGTGTAWKCVGDSKSPGCCEHAYSGLTHPRAIVFAEAVKGEDDREQVNGYDALGYTGVPTTASPPVFAPDAVPGAR